MADYLYNGIRLPQLPEWDKTVYPYAYISYSPPYYHFLRCSQTPAYYNTNSTPVFSIWNPSIDCAFNDGAFGIYDTDWGEWMTHNNAGGFGLGAENPDEDDTTLIWCNHDVTYPDGTVFMKASEPVPVEPIDPTSFMQGWLIGKRLAAMRGELLNDDTEVELIDGILYIKNAKAILTNGILEMK